MGLASAGPIHFGKWRMTMATVSKDLADKLKADDGYYSDDPRVMRIVEYTNAWGAQAYGLEYKRDLGKYRPSQYVINPKVYWEAKD
jgi:hypothetical protein